MSSNQHCSYRLLENGIHQFVYLTSHREAMDEFYQHFAPVFDQAPLDQTLRMMIEMRQTHLPPAPYAIQTAREFYRTRPHRPTMRVAYLYDGFWLTLLKSFLEMLNLQSNRRYFSRSEQAQAIAWLLADD